MQHYYQPDIQTNPILEGEELQHCVKVMRKRVGDEIGIFDGKGNEYRVAISELTSKMARLVIKSETTLPPKNFRNHIAIAPTKSSDRLEWFVEKACELGVDEISIMLTANCERRKQKIDRLEKKAISALKQSKTGYLTVINEMVTFAQLIEKANDTTKYIAVVHRDLPPFSHVLPIKTNSLILIGPEGDFTEKEVELATSHSFIKVALGRSVLRTETAGLVAAHTVNIRNDY